MKALGTVVAFVPATSAPRAKAFYQDTLGLLLVEETPYALVFDFGGASLRVTLVDTLVPQPFTVLGWRVTAIEESVDVLVQSGITFLDYGLGQDERRIWTAPDGARIAWFQDPDGNVLSLHC